MQFFERLAVAVDLGNRVAPVALREAQRLQAVARCHLHGGGRHGHHHCAVFERLERSRTDFGARDLVPLGIGFDDAGLDAVHDDQRSFVEHFARVLQLDAKRAELTARSAATHAENETAFAQDVELQCRFDDAQRVVPRQDHRGGDELDLLRLGRHVAQHLERIGAGRVVGEVMLDRTDVVEAHRLGLDGELRFLHERLDVRSAVEILISEMQSDFHDPCPPCKTVATTLRVRRRGGTLDAYAVVPTHGLIITRIVSIRE
jgi:hypothetical protein